MKIAVLYDIHGNLPALEAVLEEIYQLRIDRILVGGDVIVGPMSRECLDKLLQITIPVQFILGNCEVFVIQEMNANLKEKLPKSVLKDIQWTAGQLLPKHQKIMSEWPKTIKMQLKFADILFCHATPRSENEIFTKETDEHKLKNVFKNLGTDIVICGHTHMQFDRNIANIRVINAGSIGMPFGKSGASWLLIDSSIEFRHTNYDFVKAVNLVLETEYPSAEDFALNNVLEPPTQETMLEIFSKTELKYSNEN